MNNKKKKNSQIKDELSITNENEKTIEKSGENVNEIVPMEVKIEPADGIETKKKDNFIKRLLSHKRAIKITLISVVSMVLVVGIIVGVLVYNKKNSKSKKTIEVYDVANFYSPDMWYSYSYNSGYVVADMNQECTLDSTKEVEEVYVSVGDEVKVGTPLFKYDTSGTSIEAESKQADIDYYNAQIASNQKRIDSLKNTSVTQGKLDVSIFSLEDNMPLSGVSFTLSNGSNSYSGTSDADGNAVINNIVAGTYQLKVTSAPEGYALPSSSVNVSIGDAKEYSAMSYLAYESPDEESGSFMDIDGEGFPIDGAYSKESINEEINDLTSQNKELQSQVKGAQIEYEKLQQTLNSGVVKSTVEGKVTTVLDQEEAISNSKPFIVVSGGEGYYVKGTIAEISLDEYKVGDKLIFNSYENGSVYTATITKITEIPETNYDTYGQNPNSSYYGYYALIDNPEGIMNGAYGEVTFDDTTSGSHYYIPACLIRSENGKNYVLKADKDGYTVKQYITTDGSYSQSVKVIDGIEEGDRLAFPYSKNAVEGVKVTDGDLEDLYSY